MNQAQPRIPDNGHDEEIDPAELVPSTSGNAPIITVPAPRDEGTREEIESLQVGVLLSLACTTRSGTCSRR